jgi:hypothetical protein
MTWGHLSPTWKPCALSNRDERLKRGVLAGYSHRSEGNHMPKTRVQCIWLGSTLDYVAASPLNPYPLGRVSNAEREGVDQATSAQQHVQPTAPWLPSSRRQFLADSILLASGVHRWLSIQRLPAGQLVVRVPQFVRDRQVVGTAHLTLTAVGAGVCLDRQRGISCPWPILVVEPEA